jgi:hypothetical protein
MSTDRSPDTAVAMATGVSGMSQIRAESTSKYSPFQSTRSPVNSSRMI